MCSLLISSPVYFFLTSCLIAGRAGRGSNEECLIGVDREDGDAAGAAHGPSRWTALGLVAPTEQGARVASAVWPSEKAEVF